MTLQVCLTCLHLAPCCNVLHCLSRIFVSLHLMSCHLWMIPASIDLVFKACSLASVISASTMSVRRAFSNHWYVFSVSATSSICGTYCAEAYPSMMVPLPLPHWDPLPRSIHLAGDHSGPSSLYYPGSLLIDLG